MITNPYRVVVELPKSDGFHTTDDRTLAEIAQRKLRAYLSEPFGIPGCTVRIVKDTEQENEST